VVGYLEKYIFRKFHRQHQCTLQLVWGQCTVYCTLK
jgi:hypothetical protein